MIGTGAQGNVWVGAGSPHGMVKLAVDSRQSRPGYSAWKPITGASFVHVSGTGGPESYQVPTVFPMITSGAAARPGNATGPPWFAELRERHAGIFKPTYRPPPPAPGFALPNAPPESANKPPPDEGMACCTKISLWSGRRDEVTSVGYYAATLEENDVHVELAASGKVGIQRWTYVGGGPRAEKWLTAVIDVSKHASDPNNFVNGTLRLVARMDDRGRKVLRFSGGGTYVDGWSQGLGTAGAPHGQYDVFFCGETDAFPASVGFWDGRVIVTDHSRAKSEVPRDARGGEEVLMRMARKRTDFGLLLSFPVSALPERQPMEPASVRAGPSLELRMGLSGKSEAVACRNFDESPFRDPRSRDGTLEAAVASTRAEWDEVLLSIEVDDKAPAPLRTQFYSALYRAFLMPTNYTGDEPARWGVPAGDVLDYFTDFYTLWDIFRTQLPLITLLRPATGSALVRTLISIWQAEGYMPDSRVGAWNGITQLGSNGDCVLADAIAKGLDLTPGELKLALEAAKKDAEVEPNNWFLMGRGQLKEWKELGYIPAANMAPHLARSAARTLEYSYNDFCVAKIAEAAGRKEDAAKYLKRSRNWRNLWNSEITSHGSTGFVMAKTADGNWAPGKWTDPTYCAPGTKLYDTCYLWRSPFYESSSWTYSFYAPHDMGKLVELAGGREAFVKRLDTFFFGNETKLYDPSNEPSFLIPFGYIYAGRPDKTVDIVRTIVRDHFRATPDGLPGNDDAGAMSAWLIFALLGFYPVAGQDVYLVAAPFFRASVLRSRDGDTTREFKIAAYRLSARNRYVSSARLNGRKITRSWFRHSEIWGQRGSAGEGGDGRATALLELWMTDRPTAFGTRDIDLPPSLPD
ncbi:glycosyl hydrolase family 92-domain-containing protein [Hyaloraphidium curvatum]|nr:glycosyl hydrolase family 92-domain-containing protein [Hyaloraphidium curvatum]